MTWAVSIVALLGACDAPSPPDAGNEPMVSSELAVVCNADGTTQLNNFDVVTSSDGVHINMDNRAGETVSLNGTGRDFEEGITEQVSQIPPGDYEVACWPLSKHSGPEPDTQTILVTDPKGLWARPGLTCPKGTPGTGSATLDYASGASGEKGDPIELARRVLRRMDTTDEVVTVGYPDAEFREVALIRDNKQIAHLSYSPTEDGGWLLGGYSACDPKMVDISGGP